MPYQTLGSIIEKERIKKNLSQETLSEGVCTPQTLYDIETNRYSADFLMTEILLERLGRSPDKLEIVLASDTYGMIAYRERLEAAVQKGDKKTAARLLRGYPRESRIDEMYRARMGAELSYYAERDASCAGELLKRAVLATLPGFSYEKMEGRLISTVEMENLLALERMNLETGQTGEAEKHLEACMRYIEGHFTDREENAKVYAKCAWLLARVCFARREYGEAAALCEAGLERLRKNTMLYFMFPLLELIQKAERELGASEKQSRWAAYERSLGLVWERFAEPWYATDSILHDCCQREFHLDRERIRAERLARGMTQEELADGIYKNAASLSRVESGKVSPSKKMFEKLMERLGVEKGRYNPYAVTESFETMELRQDIDRFASRGNYAEVERALNALKGQLDLRIAENARIIEDAELLVQTSLYKKSPAEMLERRIALVADVFDYEREVVRHVPMRNEVLWLNHLCVDLWHMGEKEKADRIYEKILESINGSKIKEKFRYRSYSLVLNNYANHVMERERIVEGLKLECECGKASMIYAAVINYVLLLEREGEPEEKRLAWSEAVYYMSDLFYFGHIKQMYGEYLMKKQIKILL